MRSPVGRRGDRRGRGRQRSGAPCARARRPRARRPRGSRRAREAVERRAGGAGDDARAGGGPTHRDGGGRGADPRSAPLTAARRCRLTRGATDARGAAAGSDQLGGSLSLHPFERFCHSLLYAAFVSPMTAWTPINGTVALLRLPYAFTSTWTYAPLFLIFTLESPSRVPGPLEAVLSEKIAPEPLGFKSPGCSSPL